MAVGVSVTTANEMLDDLIQPGVFGVEWWVQLHVGDPGASGTDNIATNNLRVLVEFASSAVAASIENTEDAVWPTVPADEDYTYITLWNDEFSGSFKLSGALTAVPVTTGAPFVIYAGSLILTVTSLAA